MEIIATSVHLIDYENGEIRTITPPEAFGEYVSGLIGDINSNTTVREFMTLSVRTEVINAILDTQAHINNPQTIQDNANIIAMRLLRAYLKTQYSCAISTKSKWKRDGQTRERTQQAYHSV